MAKDDLAFALNNLGAVKNTSGAKQEAAAAYEEAYELRRQLVVAQPARDGWVLQMEESLSNLVNVLRNMGDDGRRLLVERRYLALEQELAARPGAEAWRAEKRLAALYWTAEATVLTKDGEAAFDLYEQVIEVAEPF